MNPMSTAPQDGTRILLKYTLLHYRRYEARDVDEGRITPNELGRLRRVSHYSDWLPSGEKWEEMHWVSRKEQTGSDPHWEPWEGSDRAMSTHHVSMENSIGWLPLPEETAVDDSSH